MIRMISRCRPTRWNHRKESFLGDQVTWSKDARRKQHEDTLCAWLSLDEVASYEEDARLKTEEPEEEDEKECEELSGMSSVSANKLQILWDYFIHAEPQSYEVPLPFPEFHYLFYLRANINASRFRLRLMEQALLY